jgi:hypothetical protein
MKKIAVILLCLVSASASAITLPVSVTFDPLSTDVEVGDIFDVDVVASIQDPVLGWGLDVSYDTGVLSQVGSPVIGGDWNVVFTPDGDGLAGIAPFPTSVSGTDVLLATLSFEALAAGSIVLSASATPGDLTEGFPLVPPGGFAEVTFEDGAVSVASASQIPEPETFALLGLGMAGMVFGRRRRIKA